MATSRFLDTSDAPGPTNGASVAAAALARVSLRDIVESSESRVTATSTRSKSFGGGDGCRDRSHCLSFMRTDHFRHRRGDRG